MKFVREIFFKIFCFRFAFLYTSFLLLLLFLFFFQLRYVFLNSNLSFFSFFVHCIYERAFLFFLLSLGWIINYFLFSFLINKQAYNINWLATMQIYDTNAWSNCQILDTCLHSNDSNTYSYIEERGYGNHVHFIYTWHRLQYSRSHSASNILFDRTVIVCGRKYEGNNSW